MTIGTGRKAWRGLGGGWLWATLALVLLGTVAGCSRAPEPAFRGGARLSVEPPSLDFGTVAQSTEVKAVFALKNAGDSPLSIEKAVTRVVEGCCPPQPVLSSTSLAPGKKASLSLNIKMPQDMSGPHRFEVLIYSNDAVSPLTTVEVKGAFR